VIARREKLDPVGFAVLAVLSGLGGGLIRDTLLQRGTPIALTDYAYLLTGLGAAAFSFVVRVERRLWERMWPVVDALALGCWAATGAQKTLDAGLGWLPAILLGAITAVGGGAVRDIVLRRVPAILGGNTLYATCAIAASGALVILDENGYPTAGLLAGLVVGAGMCLLARWRGWILPSADAWSPAQVIPTRYRIRRHPGTLEDDAPRENGDDPCAPTHPRQRDWPASTAFDRGRRTSTGTCIRIRSCLIRSSARPQPRRIGCATADTTCTSASGGPGSSPLCATGSARRCCCVPTWTHSRFGNKPAWPMPAKSVRLATTATTCR
jgi:uncharacterized membrane protein YeiH